MKKPIRVSLYLLSALLACGCALVFEIRHIASNSMARTLCEGDYVLALRETFSLAKQTRRSGQVILFQDPAGAVMVKRVAAVPGERLRIESGVLIRNGVKQQEDYVCRSSSPASSSDHWPNDFHIAPGTRDIAVPGGSVFVLADNRDRGGDSRTYGSVPDDRILGRVLLRLPRLFNSVACPQECIAQSTGPGEVRDTEAS